MMPLTGLMMPLSQNRLMAPDSLGTDGPVKNHTSMDKKLGYL